MGYPTPTPRRGGYGSENQTTAVRLACVGKMTKAALSSPTRQPHVPSLSAIRFQRLVFTRWPVFSIPHPVEAFLSYFIQINLSGAFLTNNNGSPLGPWGVYGVGRLNDSLSILISCQNQFEW